MAVGCSPTVPAPVPSSTWSTLDTPLMRRVVYRFLSESTEEMTTFQRGAVSKRRSVVNFTSSSMQYLRCRDLETSRCRELNFTSNIAIQWFTTTEATMFTDSCNIGRQLIECKSINFRSDTCLRVGQNFNCSAVIDGYRGTGRR